MLHHNQRGTGLVQAAAHGVADFEHTGRVQVCRGLVKQDQARTHGEDPCQRQALFLPAGEGRRRMVQRQVGEPDVVQRLVHAGPDGVAGHGEVFGAEGDVVANAGEDHLCLRVLLHQSGPAALLPGHGAVNQQRARLVGVPGVAAVVVYVPQHPCQGVEERGLAGTGRSQEKHPLPRADLQVEGTHGRFGAPRMAPAPAAGRDGSRTHRDGCLMPRKGAHQEKTGSVAALRDAKELSTPVLARPRVAIQDSAPAMMAPEMAVKMMYASLSPAA